MGKCIGITTFSLFVATPMVVTAQLELPNPEPLQCIGEAMVCEQTPNDGRKECMAKLYLKTSDDFIWEEDKNCQIEKQTSAKCRDKTQNPESGEGPGHKLCLKSTKTCICVKDADVAEAKENFPDMTQLTTPGQCPKTGYKRFCEGGNHQESPPPPAPPATSPAPPAPPPAPPATSPAPPAPPPAGGATGASTTLTEGKQLYCPLEGQIWRGQIKGTPSAANGVQLTPFDGRGPSLLWGLEDVDTQCTADWTKQYITCTQGRLAGQRLYVKGVDQSFMLVSQPDSYDTVDYTWGLTLDDAKNKYGCK